MGTHMSEVSSLLKSVGAISTAVITLGTCGASASSFDFPEYSQQPTKKHDQDIAGEGSDYFSNGLELVKPTSSVYASGENSFAFRCYIDSLVSLRLIEEINNFSNLGAGWDGYNAEVPAKETIADAIKLIKLLPDDKLPSRVGVSNDGEISLLWEKSELFADFGLMGDGTYTYFIENKKRKLYGDEIPLTNSIPVQALELLG